MFDLSIAQIYRDERERDLVAELRDRQVLKTASIGTSATVATAPTGAAPASTRDRAPLERRATTGIRAVGRQG
jgi:SRSO17 transposase